jgi:hypothetical protein
MKKMKSIINHQWSVSAVEDFYNEIVKKFEGEEITLDQRIKIMEIAAKLLQIELDADSNEERNDDLHEIKCVLMEIQRRL